MAKTKNFMKVSRSWHEIDWIKGFLQFLLQLNIVLAKNIMIFHTNYLVILILNTIQSHKVLYTWEDKDITIWMRKLRDYLTKTYRINSKNQSANSNCSYNPHQCALINFQQSCLKGTRHRNNLTNKDTWNKMQKMIIRTITCKKHGDKGKNTLGMWL